ncbi:MAG: hypothetical protein HC883_06540 [Bdellovibrionaceae bacterium]|nr:hypothetical protein [Pseudobdellovibrionaceae bacterium]
MISTIFTPMLKTLNKIKLILRFTFKLSFQLILHATPLVYLSLADATPICEVTASPQNPERLRTMTMPDGRRIFVLGHTHGDREIPFALDRLVNQATSGLSNTQFIEKLNALVSSAWAASAQADHDMRLITALLRENPDLSFLGFEATDKVTQNNLGEYALLKASFENTFAQRNLVPSKEQTNLLTVALGPVFSLKFGGAEEVAGLDLVGFESEASTKAADLASEEAETLKATLLLAGKDDPAFLKNVGGTDFLLWDLYDDYTPEIDDARLLAGIKRSDIPPAYRTATLLWIEARLKEMAALKRRERDVVAAMLTHGSSGLLLMGEKHLVSLSRELRRQCLSTQTSYLL